MAVTRVSFSVLLPLVELAIWTALVPIQTGLICYRIRQRAPDSENISIRSGQFEMTVPRNRLVTFAFTSVLSWHSQTITAMNLPGEFLQVLISLPTHLHFTWHPAALPLSSWRSLSLPFFCLPAWWFVGRGLDGLLGRRRLHGAMYLVGSILFLLFLVLLVGVSCSNASDRADMAWLLPGLGFWTVAFGVLPLAWLRQGGRTGTESQFRV